MKRLSLFKTTFILFIFAIFLCIQGMVVQAAEYESEYAPTIYDIENKLGNSEINAVAQIDAGYIWVGTYSGLYQYDGNTFKKLDIDSNIHNVMSLLPNGSDGIWIGTNDSGLVYYSYATGTTKWITTEDGLGSNSVRSLCYGTSGELYIGTNSYLSVFNAQGILTTYSGSDDIFYIRGLSSKSDGSVAGVTNGGMVFVMKDGIVVKTLLREEEGIIFTAVRYLDQTGELILGSSDGNIFRGVVQENSLVIIRIAETGEIGSTTYLYENGEGDILVAGENGFGYLDKNRRFVNLTNEDFYSACSCIIKDYQGNVWVSSSKQGLLKLSRNPFTDIFSRAFAGNHIVNSVLIKDDILYAGCEDGLVMINMKLNTTVVKDELSMLSSVRIRNIYEDSEGKLWFSTYGNDGLVCYDGEEVTTYTEADGVSGTRIRSAISLMDNSLMVATSTGITYIQDGEVECVLGSEDGLEVEQILCMLELEDGTVLAGSDGDGVYIIKDRKVVGKIAESEGLNSLVVMRIVEYKGKYIFVTGNALYVYADGKCSVLSKFPFSNNYDVIISNEGDAWITCAAGIYIVDADELVADSDYLPQLLNSSMGLTATLVANSWNYIDEDLLYLCTGSGVRMVSMKDYETTDAAFSLLIDSVEVDGVEITQDEEGVYQLDRDAKRITIHPAVLNYGISSPLIRVFLEGFDTDGITMYQSEINEISYTNLGYGDYTFHLQVLDSNTNEVINETVIKIHKQAEIYDHVLFWVGLALAIVLILVILTWALVERRNSRVIKNQYAEIERAKEEAEKTSEYKTQFLANMSHEIRTPINTIMGMDELILREDVPGQVRQYANDIASAADSLLTIVNDVLDLSKIESGKMHIVNVEYSLSEMLKELGKALRVRADEAKLAAIFEFDSKLPDKLYGDGNRVKQVIMNLLTNAVKYTNEGSVTFKVDQLSQIDDRVLIGVSVVDTGIGIKEEDMGRLFSEFERFDEERNSKVKGTGLGLSITKQLLEMMGSRLEVESIYNEGSNFHFTISQRVVSDDTIGNIELESTSQEDFEAYKPSFIAPEADVLVVDDTPLNLAVIRGLLRSTQIHVETGESGLVALDKVKHKHYDLILLDHMMPEMDGIETLDQLSVIDHKCKGVPVIVLTANAIAGAKENYLKLGFTDYLSKPVSGKDLEAMMIKYLPVEKISEATENSTAVSRAENGYTGLNYINPDKGINYCAGDKDLYESVLQMFLDELDQESGALQSAYATHDAKNYVTHAHKLKSSGRTIGAEELFEKARELEMAGKSEDWDTIGRKQGAVIQLYLDVAQEIKTKILQ